MIKHSHRLLGKAACLATCLVLAGPLAGCGKKLATAPSITKSSRTAHSLAAAPALAGGATAAGSDQELQQLLAGVHQAQAAPGFTATVNTMDKGPAGSESDQINVAYQKPSTLHLDMIKASGQAQGATIVWSGGDSLQIKISVGFLPITTSLDITDDRVKSKNGWTIKDTEVNAVFRVLFDPQAKLQIVGQQASPDGHMLTMVQVVSAESPKPADHEVIGIDPTTGMVGLRALFTGQSEIYRLAITNIKVGAPSATEMAI